MRFLILLLVPLLLLTGCPEFQLQDEAQLDNFKELKASHEVYKKYFQKGEVPPDYLVDSFDVLLDSAIELEESKGLSWQEHAEDQGWDAPENEEEEE